MAAPKKSAAQSKSNAVDKAYYNAESTSINETGVLGNVYAVALYGARATARAALAIDASAKKMSDTAIDGISNFQIG